MEERSPDDLWLDIHRALTGDRNAERRVYEALTVPAPCPWCGTTVAPGHRPVVVTTFGDPEPVLVDGNYMCAECDFETSRWPRMRPDQAH